jgi:hypothetical protein
MASFTCASAQPLGFAPSFTGAGVSGSGDSSAVGDSVVLPPAGLTGGLTGELMQTPLPKEQVAVPTQVDVPEQVEVPKQVLLPAQLLMPMQVFVPTQVAEPAQVDVPMQVLLPTQVDAPTQVLLPAQVDPQVVPQL